MRIRGILFILPAALLFSCSQPGTQTSCYSEPFRPQFHFSPDSMWMNDPNGMVCYEGEYHLFYQYYPYSNVWGPMHWGHAITTDLVHWEHLPVALYPDSLGYIFSGSAVIDWNNSSGLGSAENPPMVALFTHHNQGLAESGSDLFQYQSIAYSLDRGRNWTKYPGNPVLQNPGIRDFRDPKVSWYEAGQKWVMVLAAHDRVIFYSSPDLINWSCESEFGENTGAHGGVWECPDLFPLEFEGGDKWVLLVSINPGGPNGGSATQYFVGEFDGNRFYNENPGTEPLWIDHGMDNYAGVTWSDIPEQDGRRIFMGWMSNWEYANQVPTERWRSAMTLPRVLHLDRNENVYLLASLPVAETELLRENPHELKSGPFPERVDITPPGEKRPGLYEMELVFEFDPNAEGEVEFGFVMESAGKEQLVAGYNAGAREVFIDRDQSGKTSFSAHFPGKHAAPYRGTEEGEIRLHAFIDLSSIELYMDAGELVMTELCFPESGYEKLYLYSSHPSVSLKKGIVYSLKSIW
jgi:fructan beta-fructosidase